MILDALFLLAALFVILLGAELFTNSIEWFGHKIGLGEGAVGSVLAAVGTALPETMIPIIAIIFTTGVDADHVGVGAILGAPFLLSTLAMFVTGAAVLAFRRRRVSGDQLRVNTGVIAHDLRYFFVAYALAIGTAFLPAELGAGRVVAAVLLIVIYIVYVKGHLDADADVDGAGLPPLRLHRIDWTHHRVDSRTPRLRVVCMQVVVALGCIIIGAFVFVRAVEDVAAVLGFDETLLALIVAPIATELPEKFNSVLWVRQGKDTLAMGNITGAMVFQSCIPTVVALLFAGPAWIIDADNSLAFASAAIAGLSLLAILVPMARTGTLTGRRLLIGGVFYLIYVALVVMRLAG